MERVAAYAASKGGIVALSRQMALDYTRDRIRVNSLIVGGVDTAMAQQHAAALGKTLEEAGSAATTGARACGADRRRSRRASCSS